MRFCLVGPTYPFRGGIAHYNTILSLQLRRRGHKVDLYSFSRGYPRLLYPGRTDRDPSAQPLPTESSHPLDPLRPWTWIQTAQAILASRPDAVLITWWVPYWAPIAILLARRLRRSNLPTFMDCQNVLPHEKNFLDRPLTAWTLRQADACIVYSAEHRQELLDVVPGMPHALVPFPPYGPLAHKMLDRLDARRRLGLDGAVALFFGFVRPYKGLSVLLRAMAEVVRHIPLHLLIVGEFWRGSEEERRLISDLGLAGWTTVVDRYIPDEELGLYFGAADVVIMPYLEPCQSGVLALAQAFRKPVIASRLGGLADGIVEGQTGLLVPPNDVSALARAIVQFYHKDLGRTMRPYLEAVNLDAGWDALTEALVDMTMAARAGPLAGWSGVYG